MDEWQHEMEEIERNLAALRARDGDLAVIDEKTFASIIEQAKGALEKKSKGKKAA